MSFEKLLGELEELHALRKSMPGDDGDQDDAEISAAAADPDNEDGDSDNDPPEQDDDELMGKSLRLQTEDGERIEAIDGTELVKSLMGRLEKLEGAGYAAIEESMTKALGVAVDLIKSQGEEIALLKSEVSRLANQGRGRKAALSVVEKPEATTMAKSEPAGVASGEFMAKALAAQAAGKITGLQVSIAETALSKGLAVPADIVNRVLA